MRVAIYQELYPPSTGGQEARSFGLARALVAVGHQVTVYCIGHPGGLPAHEIVEGINVHRYPDAPRYRANRFARRQPSAVLRYSWWVRRRAARDGNDVHFYMQWPMLHTLLRPRGVARTAIVDWCEIREHPIVRLMERTLPRQGAANTAVSAELARAIEAISGRPTEFLPGGVAVDRFRRGRERDTEQISLLYLGRISAHKNVPLAVQAFAELWSRHEGIQLRIAGFGPAEDSVRAAISGLPEEIRPDIQMLGEVSEDEKIALMQEASVLVLPSEREGFPVTVVESMAVGLPVVTVDLPENGTRSVVASYGNGRVTAPTAIDLALGIEAVLEDWNRYSERAYAASQSFDWQSVANQFVELAEKLLTGQPAATPATATRPA